MTIPTVSSIKGSGADSGNPTVDYPASGIDAGDLLLCIGVCDGAGDTISTWPGSYSTNELYNANASNHGVAISYIEAVGTEDGGSIAPTLSDTGEASNWVMILIKDWDTATPPEDASPVNTQSGDDWPASTALNPSWDSATDDTLWLAWLATDGDNTQTISTFPSNCADNQTNYSFSATTSLLAVCTDDLLTASFTVSEQLTAFSGAGDQSTSGLIAIRGATAGGSIIQAMHHRTIQQS